MKKIEAVIKQDRLSIVLDKLSKIKQGSVSYHDTWYKRLSGESVDLSQERNAQGFLYKTKIELIVDDEQVDSIINAICEGGYSGGCDGRIFVMSIEQSLRIHSPESRDFHI